MTTLPSGRRPYLAAAYYDGCARDFLLDANGIIVSSAWWGPDRTGAIDCTTNLQAVHDSVTAETEVHFPSGSYLCQGLLVSKALKFKGKGATIKTNHLSELGTFELSTGNCTFENLVFDGDATPSVKGRELFFAKQTNATNITGFDDPTVGKEITIIFLDNKTTLVAGSLMKLSGGVNFVSSANDSITLRYIAESVSIGELGWVEISRSVN